MENQGEEKEGVQDEEKRPKEAQLAGCYPAERICYNCTVLVDPT